MLTTMVLLRSFSVLVISDEADRIYKIFNSVGISIRKSRKANPGSIHDFSNYDIAFLDIDHF